MIVRLDSQYFRIITGSALIDSDLGWIRLHQQEDDLTVEINDVTEDYAVIGLWGPMHVRSCRKSRQQIYPTHLSLICLLKI